MRHECLRPFKTSFDEILSCLDNSMNAADITDISLSSGFDWRDHAFQICVCLNQEKMNRLVLEIAEER